MARKSIPLEPRTLAALATLERAKAAATLARTGEERLLARVVLEVAKGRVREAVRGYGSSPQVLRRRDLAEGGVPLEGAGVFYRFVPLITLRA